jgi:hypothetical protein
MQSPHITSFGSAVFTLILSHNWLTPILDFEHSSPLQKDTHATQKDTRATQKDTRSTQKDTHATQNIVLTV